MTNKKSYLAPTGYFLHVPESCIELPDEVMLSSGVIIPDKALLHTYTENKSLPSVHSTVQYMNE